jgi:hypothetical protein
MSAKIEYFKIQMNVISGGIIAYFQTDTKNNSNRIEEICVTWLIYTGCFLFIQVAYM